MILDILKNADLYLNLNDGFEKAFEFLQRSDLDKLKADRYEIDGDRVFAMVAKEQGRNKSDAKLETHVKYIDIQMVLSGVDNMGWRPKIDCNHQSTEYDVEKDIQFFNDDPSAWISVESGVFAIFFPHDAHLPLISSEKIHKVVVKIAIDQTM